MKMYKIQFWTRTTCISNSLLDFNTNNNKKTGKGAFKKVMEKSQQAEKGRYVR